MDIFYQSANKRLNMYGMMQSVDPAFYLIHCYLGIFVILSYLLLYSVDGIYPCIGEKLAQTENKKNPGAIFLLGKIATLETG